MRHLPYLILSLIFLFLSPSLHAQRNCGTMDVLEQQLQQDPDLQRRMDQIEQLTQDYIRRAPHKRAAVGVVTIPVVVHIVYNTAAENLSDAQIVSQIQVLNEDFRRTNADASNTPSDFMGIAADVEVEFCLATRDPNGNATNGITRTATSRTSFSSNDDVKFTSTGGQDAWPGGDYLNIWVCDLSNNLLGYAQFPGGSAATDGVVCNYLAFGRGPYNFLSGFDLGRTTTHEVGHWLNLRHIWGDGPCRFDDLVADTPPASRANYTDLPCTYPGPNSCKQDNLFDMFQNYMDYSDDVCMNLFTQGQTDRMRALFDAGGARESLTSSDGCGMGIPAEICDNLVDDDGDGLTDCADSDCASSPACGTPVEICDNAMDDDGDGLIDCADPDCTADPHCQTSTCDKPEDLATTIRKGGKEAILSWEAVSGAQIIRLR